jgi:phage-related tail protein
MVTEGFALNSLVADLRKEVVDLKLERGRLKASLASQRHYLKEVQESHKQRLAASTEAAKAANDRADQLAETVESLRGQLDAAQRAL